MRKAPYFVLVVISLLLLAAHFLRFGDTVAVSCIVALIVLLFVPRWWVARLMQFVLAFGALQWLMTLATLIQARAAQGQPWLRLAIILGAVAIITVIAGLLFQTRELKTYYRLDVSS